jgi:hypothetical protein
MKEEKIKIKLKHKHNFVYQDVNPHYAGCICGARKKVW